MRHCSFLLLLLLAACTNEAERRSSPDELREMRRRAEFDSLEINGQFYRLDSITSVEFFNARPQRAEISDHESIDDSASVKRKGDSLIFHLDNGADSVLVNDTSDDFAHFAIYSYERYFPGINSWLVYVSLYEGCSFQLIDKATGSRTDLWGYPLLSPDKKKFIASFFDLEELFNANGLQLYSVKDGKIIKEWERRIEAWGPSEVRWKDDRTICVEQSYDDGSSKEFLKKYKKMTIR